MQPPISNLPSGSSLLLFRITCQCGGLDFRFSSNGDGAVIEECRSCGALYAAGRWFADPSLSRRRYGAITS